MFERFTRSARDVVTGSVVHAEREGADRVTEEHMLLALLDQEGTRSSFAFSVLGVTERRSSVEGLLADARRRGGLTRADEEALAGIGIDVTEVVSRVEAVHGEGVLRAGRTARRRWSGHRPPTRAARKALERSLRIAVGRGDRAIGDEHILLALVASPGVVADVLADHGATYATLERAMFGAGGEGVAKAG
ncbi:Clp protease N-terminal domain-containing protein [Streptomyces sp. SP18CS02]|uniref:Clp protease N-terminal domain-containing protein n=1 Tax=Streptomyces sp. SP18CS02 TaxID=3002531 RepID=UPI002E785D28|nr:Clp protease N-terminal domain-containing protein [Streptomyces sp. SP18CS02]MEE1757262.1 Clp protease N-terminal domain-containing protein [Streptomyces sp. SP18CS02]